MLTLAVKSSSICEKQHYRLTYCKDSINEKALHLVATFVSNSFPTHEISKSHDDGIVFLFQWNLQILKNIWIQRKNVKILDF